MPHSKLRYSCATALAGVVLAIAPAQAQDGEIVVTATGSPLALDRAGQAVTVIDADEIDKLQGADIVRVLERSPGVTVSRNGGVGGFTGVRVRGAEAEQLLVLIDGIRVADQASPGGGFDFGNLLAGTIERAELLRGSNSVVWGSQAIGGVLALTTRAPDGIEASAEYGAHDTVTATLNAGGTAGPLSGGVSAGFYDDDGISAAAVGREDDGFRQWQVNGRARLALGSRLTAVANGRYVDGKLGIDGFAPPTFAFGDTLEVQDTREASGRAGLEYRSAALDLQGGVSLADIRRRNVDPAFGPVFTSRGRSERAELRGRLRLPAELALDFGAEREWTRFATGPTFGNRGKARLTSAHALLGRYGERLTLAAGARIDDHDRFGSEVSLGANGSVRLGDQWRLRASYGEGFKAPTLFQLLSDFGNPALDPERSRSYDLGVERGTRGGPLHLAVTAFRRDSRDLIDFVSCVPAAAPAICRDVLNPRPFGTYDNIARARAWGVEAEAGAKLSERFEVSAAYAYVKATNRATGRDLARRPRHALTLAADWTTPLAGLALGADLRLVSDSFDNPANTVRLDGYPLVAVRAALPVGERVELFGRVENLTDEDYATAAGYGTKGRSAYVGARARF
ncbi:MAG: TonB-dependent receptor [Novosphingobium sp.]